MGDEKRLVCTFCGAENNKTKISVVGEGTPELDEAGEVDTAFLSFTPDRIIFERVKVAPVPGIKTEPVTACQTCTKIVYLVAKELKK